MNLFAGLKRAFKYSFLIRSFASLDAKFTQLQTAKMSCLKRTHLELINPESYSLFKQYVHTSEVQYLNDIFRENGFEIRMAGGCVRDLLCCIKPHDIDFATDARPDQMINIMSDKPEIRLITTTSGKKHGTVTARINNNVQYEITTLRIDKQTDGRHAEVEFINDWKIDASRRDLTINSMFIDLNGLLYDFFNGEADLKNEEIRFVGDTEKRLQEDYLRILRYFRFHARFGKPARHDERTISIMKNNVNGLEYISGERIWTEMKRIFGNLLCRDSAEQMFNNLHIGKYMGFLQSPHVDMTEFYQTLEKLSRYDTSNISICWKPQTLFSSLISSTDELASIAQRLKFSNSERNTIAYILTNRNNLEPFNLHLFKSQLALTPSPNQSLLREHIIQYLFYMGGSTELMDEIKNWTIPHFPFSGLMVANRVQQKRQISELINELKLIWAQSEFSMSEEEMQRQVDRILERLCGEQKKEA